MTKITEKLNGSTKAVFATVIAFLGALQTAMLDDVVTNAEWVTIAAATVAAAALVYGVSNDKNTVL